MVLFFPNFPWLGLVDLICDHPGHMVENSWLGLGSIGDRPGHMSAGVGSMVVTLGEWYVTQLIIF